MKKKRGRKKRLSCASYLVRPPATTKTQPVAPLPFREIHAVFLHAARPTSRCRCGEPTGWGRGRVGLRLAVRYFMFPLRKKERVLRYTIREIFPRSLARLEPLSRGYLLVCFDLALKLIKARRARIYVRDSGVLCGIRDDYLLNALGYTGTLPELCPRFTKRVHMH